MATLNFNLLGLDRPGIAQRFMTGQQEAQAEAERNMLRQAQMQQIQQQNTLAAQQLAEYERARREEEGVRNYFAQARTAGADVTSPEFMRGLYGVSPKAAATYEQTVATRQKATTEEAARRAKLAIDKTAMYRNQVPNLKTREDAVKWIQAQVADPDMAGTPVTKVPLMDAVRGIPQDPAEFEQWKQRAGMTFDQFIDYNKPLVVGSSLMTRGGQVVGTAPRPSQLLSPEEEKQRIRIAQASRPPREPVAPTITQIQDPTNPEQMITIDARRYVSGGGVGSPGVLGASGKTPKATADKMKQEQGISQASDILDTLETAYLELDRMRAIPSQQRGMMSNVLSSIAASGAGQVAGRTFGTPEQSQRDIIASARNQMLAAMKNATGMSAQQLNSNVEFKTWLDSLTDPAKSIESNRAILDNMRKFIQSGGKYSAKKPSSAATSATAPAVGVDSTNPLLAD